jgi:hypothetical protein
MTPIDLCDQLIAAPSREDRLAIMERFTASRAHLPRQRPTMSSFDWGPRKTLTELRLRHLHMVEEYGSVGNTIAMQRAITSWRIGIGYSGRYGGRKRWKCRATSFEKS